MEDGASVEGLDAVIARINRIADEGAINAGLTAGAEHLKNIVMDYPPSTEANKPGRMMPRKTSEDAIPKLVAMGYYERGRGWWYPATGKKTLGKIIGKSHGAIRASKDIKAASAVVGYKLRAVSEDLKHRWTIWSQDKFTVILGNNASYARAVHDAEKQANFHRARGWKTAQAVVEAEGQKVVEFVKRAILENMKKG